MRESGPSPTALHTAARILWRHGWLMAVFFIVVMTGTGVATVLSPRAYRSQSRLLLRLGRENTMLDPTVTLGHPVVTVPYTREMEITSALDLLTSRALAEKVIQAVGPGVILGTAGLQEAGTHTEPDPRSAEYQLALETFNKNLNAEVVKKSSTLAVSYDASSPELAQAVLTRLITFFQERHIEINRTPGSVQFLTSQAARMESKLHQTEEELRQKKVSTGLASPETQRQLLATRLGRLEDELTQARASLAASEAEMKSLEGQMAKTPAVHATATMKGVANQSADQVRAQYALLKIKEAELAGRHGESHPEVRIVRKQLEAAEAFLRKEESSREQVTTGPNKLHEEAQLALLRLRANLAALRVREAAVAQQLRDERARLAEFVRAELEVARLQRRLDVESAQHKRYADALEQGQIDRELQSEKISNVAVVQPASFEPRAVRPRLMMNLALGAAFGLLGAAGLGVLMDYRVRGKEPGD
jgi:uncharacterized protein involved in exopolysaccharide biosynthesis